MNRFYKITGLAVIGACLCMGVATAFASGTKTVTGSGTKPADVIDQKALARKNLLPEGKKIVLEGTLSKGSSERYVIRSSKTRRAYTVLENSLLQEMVETIATKPGAQFSITARITRFQEKNYVFITKVALKN